MAAGAIRAVIVRELPRSFASAISHFAQPAAPINVARAVQQHSAYVAALRAATAAPVITVPADEAHPDCVFIEDALVVYRGHALLTRSGAPSRRGEEVGVTPYVTHLAKSIHVMHEPATLDGGDVLQVHDHIFVGLSSRSNPEGVSALKHVYPQAHVHAVDIGTDALHLKSYTTFAGDDVGLVSVDTPAGRRIAQTVADTVLEHGHKLSTWHVPDLVAANVLRIEDQLLYSPQHNSQHIFDRIAESAPHVKLVSIDYSELHKADAALTCCSVVISD